MSATLPAVIEWTDIASAWSDMLMTVFTALTVAGVAYVAVQVTLQRKQMHRDLENLYIERYWEITDRLDAAEAGSVDRERAALAYLRLCEDQCDQRADGRITDQTWKIWGASMYGALLEDEYARVLGQQPDGSFLQLRAMQTEGAGYDPSDLTPAQRKRVGL